ncbi:MAG TPA: M20 family metallopeptidase [Pseudoclavibacter sp.]|nr:M20 family metallopeptidase [Pseudoclavibacter sp.]
MSESVAHAMTSRLRELVQMESPSADTAASARISEVLSLRLRELGAHVEKTTTAVGTHISAHLPGDLPGTILLLGHSDTVWDIGTLDARVPWREFDTDEGVPAIAGPGVFDMKSGLVIIETALSRIRGTSHPTVHVVITCDEEIGSPTSTDLVTAAARESTVVLGFESPHPDGALKIGRKGSTRIRLSTTGREAHAALDPDKGINAIDEIIDRIVGDVRPLIQRALESHPGSVLYNLGGISGGGRANVIPAHAEALLGLRFSTPEAERDVLGQLSGLSARTPGATLASTVLSQRPVWAANRADQDLAAALGLAGRPAAGAADTNTTGALGVPTVDGMGPAGGGAHAESEHLLVPSFVQRADTLASFLCSPLPASLLSQTEHLDAGRPEHTEQTGHAE